MKDLTLTQTLQRATNSGGKGITFIETSARHQFLDYHELYKAALRVLWALQKKGVQPKNELVFQVEDNKTFCIFFWACILGGFIPVPLSVGKNDDHKLKLFNVWQVLSFPWLVVESDAVLHGMEEFVAIHRLKKAYEEMSNVVIRTDDLKCDGEGKIFESKAGDLAFVQFSSGSTGAPKGVMLTHANLLANLDAIHHATRYTDKDATISWMPLTHDMGLIGFHLSPMYSGLNQYIISTAGFIRNPAIWFDKVSEHKITSTCSPNFGYKYLMKHCGDSIQFNWDLSCLKALFNGAEPISEKLCREFMQAYSWYGLKPDIMTPVYGLAEASLAVTISGFDEDMNLLHIDRRRLNVGDGISIKEQGNDTVSFVSVGKPVNDCDVRITDENDRRLPDNILGHIQVKGKNITAGYYNNEAETKKVTTADGWLKTGDLGFIHNGALFVTGRYKDILFLNGQNFYAHDIERVAEEVEGIELNKIVVAGFLNEVTSREEVIAFVFYRGDIEKFIPLAGAVKNHINKITGIELSHIIPVTDIPRTTSGKLQRFKLLEKYRNGDFSEMEQLLSKYQNNSGSRQQPANVLEEKLMRIWEKVLQKTVASTNDNFFAIGGNSLKAAEMAMLIFKEFHVEPTVDVIYKHPTIHGLSEFIQSREKINYIPVPVSAYGQEFPLAAAQKRIYFFQQLNKTSVSYNIPVAFKMEGYADVEKLESCIKKLISRYDTFRMTFHIAEEPVCRVHDEFAFHLEHICIDAAELHQTLQGLVKPFDLDKEMPFRAKLVQTAGENFFLFFDFHHLVADGVSVANFLHELVVLYNGHELPDLPVRYKDFVAWERSDFQSEKIAAQENYWLKQLQGELPVLEMPLDVPRPPVFDNLGEKLEFILGKDQLSQLQSISNANHTSLHVVLFAIYNILLSKYTGQEELIIGIPVAGRRHPDLLRLPGMFANNLAIRSVISGDETFQQFLMRCKENVVQALDNQEYPFDRLVQRLAKKTNPGRNPLFDTMFVYQNMSMPEFKDLRPRLSRFFFDPGFSKFDISMEVFESGEAIHYYLEYSTSLFKQDTIKRLSACFESLVNSITGNPHEKISDLAILDAETRQAYIAAFNNTKVDYPDTATIPRLFEKQVEEGPGRIAFEYEGEKLTYAQVNEKADALAACLREKGVSPGVVVAVLLKRSPDFIISILAVMKAGGYYLPIDTGLPKERVLYMITDSRSRLVITGGIAGSSVSESLGNVPVIDVTKALYTYASTKAVAAAGPGDPAYIIYTSGSTGQPKGVIIKQQSLVNYSWWAAKNYVKEENCSFAFFTSVSFDLTVTAVFTPLITGNRIIIYSEEGDKHLLGQVISDNRSAVLKLTPSHLRMIREYKIKPAGAPRIKRLIVGGEELTTQLAKDIFDHFGSHIEIYNEYGPTEATVGCMIKKFNPGDTGLTVPIGVPAANTQIYLLDKYLQPVPAGVPGELYISGDGLATGYLHNEKLTNEKFIANPFIRGQKMYRTGDIAKRLPDGQLEYAGRRDQQVKLNGYRVEPGEIENQLMKFEGIGEALVMVRTDKTKRTNLHAYYTTKAPSAKAISSEDIRNFLATLLPYYMIPLSYTEIEKIPVTINGKIDYEALPQPVTGDAAMPPHPRDEVESLLLDVWKEVLQTDKLTAIDNFFELGGDSIKAVQISSRLLQRGIILQSKYILTYQTIAQIGRHVQFSTQNNVYEQSVVEGERGLTPIENWFFSQRFNNPGYYCQSVLLGFKKQVDISLLSSAFQHLVTHHDGLRSNYNADKNTFFYNSSLLQEKFKIDIFTIDKGGDKQNQLNEIGQQVKSSIDISRGFLIKAVVIRDPSGEEYLLVAAHHLLVDGVSWRILLQDLYTIYTALEAGASPRLPLKTASAKDWEKALTGYKQTGLTKDDELYWREVEAVDFSILPDFPTNDFRSLHLQSVAARLGKERTSFLIKEAHKTYNTEVPVLLNTALLLALNEWTTLTAFVVMQESHGRHLDNIDIARTTGWFTNLYPVKLELIPGQIGDQIKSVKEQLKKVRNYGMSYFIYRNLNRNVAEAKEKMPEISFNFLGQFDKELNNELFYFCHLATGADTDPENNMTAAIALDLMVINHELTVVISYNGKLYKTDTMTQFKNSFLLHLNRILDHIESEKEIYFTPSDFQSVNLNQEELDLIFK